MEQPPDIVGVGLGVPHARRHSALLVAENNRRVSFRVALMEGGSPHSHDALFKIASEGIGLMVLDLTVLHRGTS